MDDTCSHSYGVEYPLLTLVGKGLYHQVKNSKTFEKFTYCPWCKAQVHTIDGIVLGLPEDDDFDEDDCIKRGCAD